MKELQDPVVASLGNQSAHPYSSVAMSSNRKYAIIAGKDTLQLMKVSPKGLSQIRSMRISQHFQTAVADSAQMAKIFEEKQRGSFVRDTFGLAAAAKQSPNPHQSNMSNVNVVITDVAWSKPQRYKGPGAGGAGDEGNTPEMVMEDDEEPRGVGTPSNKKKEEVLDSIVAAAGSNGAVVVWSARRSFLADGDGSASSMANQQPEAILSQHSRAVNRLAWHPRRPGLLLSASQDATVKLWVRRPVPKKPIADNSKNRRSWFNFNVAPSMDDHSFTWHCRATFEPKSEAVRDIRWSPLLDDVFAIVTVSGCLVVYNMFVSARPIVKISAHSGDATTLDWHPTRPYIISTGGAGDRCVKIWDLEPSLVMGKDDSNMAANSNTANSRTDSVASDSSSTDRSVYTSSIGHGPPPGQPIPPRSLSFSLLNSSRHKANSVSMLHVLTVSATVTRLKWRPPANDYIPAQGDDPNIDRHESMLAVATAPIKGASAGGSGVLSLWTYNRPFMPLSVLEGHQVGAVSDFFWLDTPHPDYQRSSMAATTREARNSRNIVTHESDTPSDRADSEDKEAIAKTGLNVWQHVLSVGRDGQCLIQSFARGDRPISRVPPSCFALANKSPFSRGFGSLQICSVHQNVPYGKKNDFWLAGIRQDALTAEAPGIFREMPGDVDIGLEKNDSTIAGKRLPQHIPDLVFNSVDHGVLDGATPVAANKKAITVAPEVVHLSRFAKGYKLHPNGELPTRVSVCLHNGNFAESLQCGHLARMWRTVAEMLEGTGLDELPKASSQPANVMQFVLLPTLKSLLFERGDAGDVQTCVILCEVLQVLQSDETTRIPGLSLNLVREWYLSYIDLLRDMCLFSLASSIIGTCKDSFIGALNQQSTTISEGCPRCGKALIADGSSTTTTGARRECKSCRRRIGLCFLCHEPVKGMFVWCPGCGHGGHLDHALQWFGGPDGRSVREMCPTGCGHKCNFMQQLSAFPRTGSMKNINAIGTKPQVDLLPAGLM